MGEVRQPLREPLEQRVREVAGTIYGTILVLALVAGLSEDETVDAWQLLVSVVATTIVFWVAHAYAEVLSKRVVAGRSLSWHETWSALSAEWSMVRAGVPAVIALGLAELGAYSTDTGVDIAIGLGVASLFALGLQLGRREGATRLQTLASAVLNASLGLVIVVLKVLVH
jgi:hypothetical protein